ncbi:hypothetical protein QBC42DRAFT_280047 [Cladorrhinum samala]|uniref:Endosomal spry domain-containing protein n=1 Tax=Cladorrhinum samala TaxID=585594 RepID=A0AAV9H9T8_9PEZI|nr:hypothetical protein QBC42DRAFT_280047 [Cladorrhinum samala]
MAPAIINDLVKSTLRVRDDVAGLGPIAARTVLLARDNAEPTRDPAAGSLHPNEINNNAVFAVFGLLGAAFVITGIWFFFWAKNGGFYFKENDWDDYKSTVLRRKVGPNGTIYTDATPSTILGGGSVYKDIDDRTVVTRDDDLTTVVSGTTGITGITGGVSDISGREKRRKKREQKERDKERRREERRREKEERRTGRKLGPDGIIDEEAEKEAEKHLRDYQHEKPARVGGLNREADGSEWDGSNPSWSTVGPSDHGGTSTVDSGSTVTSDLIQKPERMPTKHKETSDRQSRGIRKVYSTADKTAAREEERIRAEARRLREKGRSSKPPKRDFSFTAGAEESMALRRIEEGPGEESVVSGSYITEGSSNDSYVDHHYARAAARERARSKSRARAPPPLREESEVSASDAGTKVYTHPHHIPTASEISDFAYAEEKRKRRGGAGARRQRGGGDGDSSVA